MAAGQMDLEHELQEAMTETVVGEESLDGESNFEIYLLFVAVC